MSWLKIELPAAADVTPNFSQQVDLDGVSYALRFRFNDLGAAGLAPGAQLDLFAQVGQPYWTVDLFDDVEAVCYVAGWKLEPIIAGGDFEEVLAGLTPDDVWQLCLFGRFFRPGRLTAWASAPVTTMQGLASVGLFYADFEEARAVLASAA